MSQKLKTAIAVVGIDIGKNSFHVVGLDQRDAIVLRQAVSAVRRFRSMRFWCQHRHRGKGGMSNASTQRNNDFRN